MPSTTKERLGRVVRWTVRNPGDAVTVALVLLLTALAVISIFIPGSLPWLFAAFAAVLSAQTLLLIEYRRRDGARESTAHIREIPAEAVGHELESLLSGATGWTFRGGSARWQRSHVLPALAKITDWDVQYQALIISPFDEDLCDRYAEYRRRSRKGDTSSGTDIRNDLLAFIYATAIWARRSRITPEISLLSTFSPLRVDGSSHAMVVTVADPTRAALRASAEGWYFLSMKDEFNLHKQSAPLSLPDASRSNPETAKAAREFFEALVSSNAALLEFLTRLDSIDWSDVVQRLGTPHD